jgi:NADH-quinone oxidoreductase subunit C
MTPVNETLAALQAKFGPSLPVEEFRGDVSVTVPPEILLDVLGFLKTEAPGPRYTFLADLMGVDDWPEEPRFTVHYLLRDLARAVSLRVKCRVAGDAAELPTATGLFINANWYEREVWDMFGVRFRGHPDLRRILMPAAWEGHPLRKDYPLGYEEVQFTFNFDEIDRKKPYVKE